MHNLKVENYVLFGELAEDLSPGETALKGLHCRGKGGPRIYRSFAKQKQVVGTSKD